MERNGVLLPMRMDVPLTMWLVFRALVALA